MNTIKYASDRASSLIKLVANLPPELLPEAITAAKAIENVQYRVPILTVLQLFSGK